MKKVSFTEMKKGTKEEYLFLDKHEKKYIKGTADRLLKFMSGLNSTLDGYKITRLEHSLQTATRALNDKANEEMIVASLLHDIGDELAPTNHAECAAAILKPFVTNTMELIISSNKKNKNILFEGAQGSMLDIDHGTYPFVTSSNTVSSQSATGSGIGTYS